MAQISPESLHPSLSAQDASAVSDQSQSLGRMLVTSSRGLVIEVDGRVISEGD